MTVKSKKEKEREEIYIGFSDHREVVNGIGVHSIQIVYIIQSSREGTVCNEIWNEVCNGSFTKLFMVRLCGVFCALYSQSKIALRSYNKIILNNNLQILVYEIAICAS